MPAHPPYRRSHMSHQLAHIALTCLTTISAFACADRGEARDAGTEGRATSADSVDWKAIDAIIGRPNVTQPSDVHRFNFPRSDLRVTAAGVSVTPALALGGWVAMKAMGSDVVAMGDLVLTEDELAPVIARLQQGGIEQTAIHHHLLRESPRVYYVHVHAHGEARRVAQAIQSAVALTKIPAPSTPSSSPSASAFDLDTAALAKTLGYSGRVNGGVYQVSVPRSESIHDGDFEVPPSMGLGTAINFQPTGGGKVAITGDFVMLGEEVNPVIKALTSGGVDVTSLHNHMLSETPRLFFMHFWANDDAMKLARTLRAALALTKSKLPAS
ncbi:MAG: DUF1259 domain-containing protein [Gemmatimonadaceae bacterium]